MSSPAAKYAAAFANKVVLVTGASSGIGRSLAVALARAGAKVGALARREQRLTALATELDGCQLLPLVADITDAAACERAVQQLVDTYGGLDLVINNAGASMNALFHEADPQIFHKMMDVNYFGSVYISRAAFPHLRASKGQVVFITSVVGKRGFPTRSGYAAAKFAVQGLFESLRVEWAEHGINVALVAPGYTDTEIRRNAISAGGTHKEERTIGGVMTPDQAAAGILQVAAGRGRHKVMTLGGWLYVWTNKLLPWLGDYLAPRLIGHQPRK